MIGLYYVFKIYTFYQCFFNVFSLFAVQDLYISARELHKFSTHLDQIMDQMDQMDRPRWVHLLLTA
jgi:sulfur relay (sulfurtransferase) DsrF/TusC family protein